MSKIMVTGATGMLGKSVVEGLLRKLSPSDVSVLVRNKAKAQGLASLGVTIYEGNYDNLSSLVNAFKNADTLYFVSGSEIHNRDKQHENVVNAARQAGMRHVLYTSFMRVDESVSSPISFVADSHIKTENLLKESGLTYTILKHTIYMDMIPMFLGPDVLKSGVVYFPAGDGRVSFVQRNDMADFAVAVLTGSGHDNKEYNVTGEESVTFSQIAGYLSEISGKTISYISPGGDEFRQTLSNAGLPAEIVSMSAGFAEAFRLNEFALTNTLIRDVSGVVPVSVKEFLNSVYR